MKLRPSDRGVYALFLKVPKRQTVSIGKLGTRDLARGVYVYVGSARNSLVRRISRHIRLTKRKHWHIDYLVDGVIARPSGVAWKPTSRRIECSVSRKIGRIASNSVKGFGCSDCDCASHLQHLALFHRAVRILARMGFHYSRKSQLPQRLLVFRTLDVYQV